MAGDPRTCTVVGETSIHDPDGEHVNVRRVEVSAAPRHPGAHVVSVTSSAVGLEVDPVTARGWEAIDLLVNALIATRTAVFVENDARWGQVDVGDPDPTADDDEQRSREQGYTCPHQWREDVEGQTVRHQCTRQRHLDKSHVRGDGTVVVARTPPRSRSIFEQFGLDPATGLPPEDPAPPTLRDVDPTAHGGNP